MLILVPLFVALLQIGLTLYVRNTVAACAQEGARYGADADFVAQGAAVMTSAAAQRATGCINDSLPSRYARDVSARPGGYLDADGVELDVVEVRVLSPIPWIGFWAPGAGTIDVRGDALQEAARP
jgi:TadE-like protein